MGYVSEVFAPVAYLMELHIHVRQMNTRKDWELLVARDGTGWTISGETLLGCGEPLLVLLTVDAMVIMIQWVLSDLTGWSLPNGKFVSLARHCSVLMMFSSLTHGQSKTQETGRWRGALAGD